MPVRQRRNIMADITLTDANFDKEVIKNGKPVLVDFWAVWCGPCRVQDPILAEVEKAVGDKIVVGKLNVDENPVTAQKYGIMSIPTLMIFKNGTVVKQYIGVQSKDTLIKELNSAAV